MEKRKFLSFCVVVAFLGLASSPLMGQTSGSKPTPTPPAPALSQSDEGKLVLETPATLAVAVEMEYVSLAELQANKKNYTVADLEALRTMLQESSALTPTEEKLINAEIARLSKKKTLQH